MAAPIQAVTLKCQVAPDSSGTPGTFAAPSNNTSVKVSIKGENVDITVLNSAKNRNRLATLLDVSGSVEFHCDFSDTALSTIRNAILNGTPIWVKAFITATNYIQAQMLVEGLDFTLDPSSTSKMSASLTFCGTGTTPLTIA
jgi:uncharacterized protein with von Willebrand factor type A (vWA) domain